MRVSRRSHLSRIASDDEWFADPWWEDGATQGRESASDTRQRLSNPTIATAANVPDQNGDHKGRLEGPFIDSRLSRGRNGKSTKAKRGNG